MTIHIPKDKIFYHGSNYKFDTFDKSKIRENKLGLAFNFTDDYSIAYQYGDNILKVNLDLNNPLTLDIWDATFPYKWFNRFGKLFTGELDFEYGQDKYNSYPYTYGEMYNHYKMMPEFIQILEEMGYDGIAIPEEHQYGVFEPEQIHIIKEDRNMKQTRLSKVLMKLSNTKNLDSLKNEVIKQFLEIVDDTDFEDVVLGYGDYEDAEEFQYEHLEDLEDALDSVLLKKGIIKEGQSYSDVEIGEKLLDTILTDVEKIFSNT